MEKKNHQECVSGIECGNNKVLRKRESLYKHVSFSIHDSRLFFSFSLSCTHTYSTNDFQRTHVHNIHAGAYLTLTIPHVLFFVYTNVNRIGADLFRLVDFSSLALYTRSSGLSRLRIIITINKRPIERIYI